MSLLINGIDPAKEVVELWYELTKTQAILDKILSKIKPESILLSQEELSSCEEVALRKVRSRYPTLNINKT